MKLNYLFIFTTDAAPQFRCKLTPFQLREMACSYVKVPRNRSRSDEIKKKALLDGSIIPKRFCFLSGCFQPLQKFNLGNVQFFYAFEDRVDETNELTLLNS